MQTEWTDDEIEELNRELRLDGGVLKAPAGYFADPEGFMRRWREQRQLARQRREEREARKQAFLDRVREAQEAEDDDSGNER